MCTCICKSTGALVYARLLITLATSRVYMRVPGFWDVRIFVLGNFDPKFAARGSWCLSRKSEISEARNILTPDPSGDASLGPNLSRKLMKKDRCSLEFLSCAIAGKWPSEAVDNLMAGCSGFGRRDASNPYSQYLVSLTSVYHHDLYGPRGKAYRVGNVGFEGRSLLEMIGTRSEATSTGLGFGVWVGGLQCES